MTPIRKSGKRDLFTYLNIIVLGIWAIVVIFPYYSSFLASITTKKEYTLHPLMLFPTTFSIDAYVYLLKASNLLSGYKNTLILLVLGVPYNMVITLCTAYALAHKDYPGKRLFTILVIFTMYFSGGLIPFYLLIKSLGLMNSLAAIILSYGANTFYAILIRNFLQSIPAELEESAKIDGANELKIFIRILLPLTLPILATVILFFAVDRWNEWFNVLLLVRDSKKWTIQIVLRNIVFTTLDDMTSRVVSVNKPNFSLGLRMAAVFMTMTPIMILYPFVQKYFMKGIMIGAVKG
jgi:putative aldouronate transport system permease protein